jgi:predicted phage terminase large subunit-like protein
MFGKDVVIRRRDLEIYLPKTNSTIKFSHLQHKSDVESHLGAQYSLIVFDEATLFPLEEMIIPLIGRLRNANVDYKPQMFWATNPAYNHGIYHWIKDFYLDDLGIPIKERSNIERFFVTQNDKPVWYATREEAEAIHGGGKDSPVQSFRSIRAHVTDNLPLLKANPGYLGKLQNYPEIRRRIMLDGSWTAREEEAGLFKREWVTMVDYPNLRAKKRVIGVDQASTPVSTASPNPDWTRLVTISKDQDGYYTIEDMVSLRDRPHIVEQTIHQVAADTPNGVVAIERDPGSSGVAWSNSVRKNLAEKGFTCTITTANKSKRARFLPFSAIAEAGYVRVVRAPWNEEFFNELEEFTGVKTNERDDICDAVSTAMLQLNRATTLPDFALPDMSITNNNDFSYSL